MLDTIHIKVTHIQYRSGDHSDQNSSHCFGFLVILWMMLFVWIGDLVICSVENPLICNLQAAFVVARTPASPSKVATASEAPRRCNYSAKQVGTCSLFYQMKQNKTTSWSLPVLLAEAGAACGRSNGKWIQDPTDCNPPTPRLSAGTLRM